MAGAIKSKGGVSERDAAKSELESAKNLGKRAEIKRGLKHHPLNPMRIIAEGRNTNFSGYPEDDKLTKAKKKYKDKFPELVKNYKSGGRVNLKDGGCAQIKGFGKARRPKKKKYA